jgi:hypothetical protein
LPQIFSYSKVLYMAARQSMTFRLSGDLVRSLRELPNQTAFVETALREAFGKLCPLCHGTGEAPGVHLAVSNFKQSPGARLDRTAAAQLKALVRLGRQLLATELALDSTSESDSLGFRLARADEVLLAGRIPRGERPLKLTH